MAEAGMWLPRVDPDSLVLPSLDELEPGAPVVRFRSLQDRAFRRELRRARALDELGSAPGQVGPLRLMRWIGSDWPPLIGANPPTPVAVAPTTLTATVARIFPFALEAGLTVNKVYFPSPNALASCLQLGIFDSLGQQIWTSGAQSTTANITTITPTAFELGAQLCYFAITNNNSASGTTAYFFSPAFLATIPRWGTVTAASGAMPASITPGSITANVGGFPIYVYLSVF